MYLRKLDKNGHRLCQTLTAPPIRLSPTWRKAVKKLRQRSSQLVSKWVTMFSKLIQSNIFTSHLTKSATLLSTSADYQERTRISSSSEMPSSSTSTPCTISIEIPSVLVSISIPRVKSTCTSQVQERSLLVLLPQILLPSSPRKPHRTRTWTSYNWTRHWPQKNEQLRCIIKFKCLDTSQTMYNANDHYINPLTLLAILSQ